MAASKSVVVSLSVVGGSAVVLLVAVLLYLYVPRKASGTTPAPNKCGAAPTVNAATGAVANYDKVLMPDGVTCGENVALLNQLCLNTVCTNPQACTSYMTYDAYDKHTHTCVQVTDPTCEQQLCDTPYCTSPSIRPPTLPPLHKRTSTTGACINPSELEVAAMCDALPDHQYVSPDCRVVELQKVIQTKALPGFINTTTLLSGVMLVPKEVGDADPLQFSYLLTGSGGAYTGMLTTTPPADASLCTDATRMCRTYTIDLLPGTVRAGKYTLTLYGRPTWSAVNTMQSVQPDVITLVNPPVDPNANAALNVVLSRDVASALLSNATVLRQLLLPLPFMYPGLALTIPPTLTVQDLKVIPASDSTGAGTANAFYMAACDPAICPLSGASSKLMPYALVFVAWSPVQPVSTTQCKSSVVQYGVRKDSAKNGASTLSLAQPTAFADLVQVGDQVKYTITTTQGTCTSQPVVLSLYIPPFSDELCHSIPILGSVLPPWMWRSDAGCVWYPDDSGAKDYYCAFEYMNPQHTLLSGDGGDGGKVKLMLADSNNKCREVLPSFPELTSMYPAATAGQPSYCNFTDHVSDVCFTGYSSSAARQVKCSPELPLGTPDSGERISNEGAFYDRLNGLVTFHGLHNTFPTALVAPIAADKQASLYSSQYYHCGADTNGSHWGINKTACGDDDAACLKAVVNAACDTGDRNICQPWKQVKGNPNLFEQTRVCFGDATFTDAHCCKAGQVYKFDDTVAVGGARGSCAPSS